MGTGARGKPEFPWSHRALEFGHPARLQYVKNFQNKRHKKSLKAHVVVKSEHA